MEPAQDTVPTRLAEALAGRYRLVVMMNWTSALRQRMTPKTTR